MTDFATALRARLVADAEVAAVCSTRIYWGIVPQTATLPYIRLTTISDPRPEHLQGYTAARVTRIQCDCFATTYAAARGLAEKVIAATVTPGVHGGVHFGRVKAQGPRDLGEDTTAGFIHRSAIDLLAEHKLA